MTIASGEVEATVELNADKLADAFCSGGKPLEQGLLTRILNAVAETSRQRVMNEGMVLRIKPLGVREGDRHTDISFESGGFGAVPVSGDWKSVWFTDAPCPLDPWAGPRGNLFTVATLLQTTSAQVCRMVREYRILDLDMMGDPFTQIPLEQFTSGAAIDGLAEVIRNLPGPVAAWRWLKAPNPRLNGELPINLMRGGRRTDLVVALEDDFGIVFD